MSTLKHLNQTRANTRTDACAKHVSFVGMKALMELDPKRLDEIQKASDLHGSCSDPKAVENYAQQNPQDVPYLLRILIDKYYKHDCDCVGAYDRNYRAKT